MIIRLLGVGQFRLDEDALEAVRTADRAVGRAVAAGDRDAFRDALTHAVHEVERLGEAIPRDASVTPDAVFPAPDSDLDDATAYVGDGGAIPG